jgi:hypothetical protein
MVFAQYIALLAAVGMLAGCGDDAGSQEKAKNTPPCEGIAGKHYVASVTCNDVQVSGETSVDLTWNDDCTGTQELTQGDACLTTWDLALSVDGSAVTMDIQEVSCSTQCTSDECTADPAPAVSTMQEVATVGTGITSTRTVTQSDIDEGTTPCSANEREQATLLPISGGRCAHVAGTYSLTTVACDGVPRSPTRIYEYGADCSVAMTAAASATCEVTSTQSIRLTLGTITEVTTSVSCSTGCTSEECTPESGVQKTAEGIYTADETTFTQTYVVTQQMRDDQFTPCDVAQTDVRTFTRDD